MEIKPHIAKLAEALSEQKINWAFGVTGGGASLELITTLHEKGVKYYPVAHEAAAVMMAGACSRDGITRAVAITIKGPGFANALPGILSNNYEARPAITISEAYSPATPAHKMHKRLDHFAASAAFVKAFSAADDDGKNLKTLLDIAQKETPGPVHLELYAEAAAGGVRENFKTTTKFSGEEILKEINEAIKNSQNPVLILGSLVLRRLGNTDWASFGVPVFTVAAAKGAIDENSIYSGGVISGEVKELSPENLIARADLIFSVGLRNTEVVNAAPYKAQHINIDSVSGFEGGFDPKINFLTASGNLAKIISELKPLFSGRSWGEDLIAEQNANLEKELFSADWMPAPVFRQIQKALPESMLVLDTGFFCTVGGTVWKAKSADNFLGSNNGRFMGTAIPTAIGVAISFPGKDIIAVAGDGGIRDYFMEIKLAVENNLPIIFVLMSDGAYGSIAASGRAKGDYEKAFQINNPGWWEAARAIGCLALKIKSSAELKSALEGWQKTKGPMFLEIPFEPEQYAKMAKKLR